MAFLLPQESHMLESHAYNREKIDCSEHTSSSLCINYNKIKAHLLKIN